MKPAPTCLTLLILHELLEETKSVCSQRGCGFTGRLEEDETSQQPSQDRDLDVPVADRAVGVSSSAVPGLGEGGRRAERVRAGSWCQSPEAPSAQGCIPGESGLCRAVLTAAAKAGQQPPHGESCRLPKLCREMGEVAWLEGAWLLTSTVGLSARKRLRYTILCRVLSCTAMLSEVAKSKSIWEERRCW